MYIINTIPHGKCFVRYLRTRCFCIRNRTSERSERVRFLIRQQLERKYRTPALSMKYSLYSPPIWFFFLILSMLYLLFSRIAAPLACSRLSETREDAKVKGTRAGREKEKGRAAPPLPSFLHFYFRIRAFSIQGTRISRSLEQATAPPFFVYKLCLVL